MMFSVCYTSGVSRGFVILILFGMGVFLGFPFQRAATWVKDAGIPTDWIRKSWFTSETGAKLYNGVYFPDLFKRVGLDGYLGAVLLTAFLCGLVVYLSKKYESSRRVSGTFIGVASEIEQSKVVTLQKESNKEFKLLSEETYTRLFVTPWSMKVGASVIAIISTLLIDVTKAGWGASTLYG